MRRKIYIHEQDEWPNFTWDNNQLLPILGKVRNLQGRIVGKMESLGFELRNEANLATLTLDIIKSTEIEGEILNPEQVRSSLARKLGMDISGLIPADRDVEGIVEVMIDAINNYEQDISTDRLFDWHAALFPTGRSGMYKIIVADWRDDSTGAMQVVSGALGKEKVHFEAPNADLVDQEMNKLIEWFNKEDSIDPVLKAGIIHLWFVTIHPFEDGNGRLARVLTDMQLTKVDGIPQRFYSMSSQIRVERKEYYEILEKTQKTGLDITNWLMWFLNCLQNALISSNETLSNVLFKHHFWNKYRDQILNKRQHKIINLLLDGFTGKLTSTKWAKINKCSADTALRDIQDLMNKSVLRKTIEGGRSTNYELIKEKG